LHPLRRQLESVSLNWIAHGLPSREQIVSTAHALARLKQQHTVRGLWCEPPRMLIATLDDAIGQGIEIIHLFGDIIGLDVKFLGLLQKPDKIVTACRTDRPRYLGLTVLQLDSEDDLAFVGHHLPEETRLIAGGPVFKHDPELAARCGIHATPANVAYFIQYMLNEVID
jgi:hypothetical protein